MVYRNKKPIPYPVPSDVAPPIAVVEFGSSVLNHKDSLAAVVQEISDHPLAGARGVEKREEVCS